MKQIDESVFKAYDLRGIYPDQIDGDFAYLLGRGYSTFLLGKKPEAKCVVVGQDMRLSSPELSERLKQGILDSGLNVVEIGLSSTPTFYFAVAYYGYDGGIQVSASHNPKEDNGFKIVLEKSYPVGKNTGINEIKSIVLKGDFVKKETVEKPAIFKEDGVLEDLMNEQLANIELEKIKKFKIVIDASNAMGSVDMEAFFSRVPGEIVKLNFDLDGNFPVHQADPMQDENIAQLRQTVVENKADFGIAIDGDADRYFLVDENGEPLRQEVLRAIMAKIELQKNPGSVVCYDIRPGKITQDVIEEMKGDPIVTPVGHSLIKEIMIENDASFGGESSGHYFYKEHYGTFEMPVVLLSRFLLFLSSENKSFSEVMKPYKKYFHSGEINRKVRSTEVVIDTIKEKYKDGSILEIDGISIEYPDFWFNVRASNTEPLVRLNLESISPEITETKVKEILKVIEEA
jgi:phosphomannomutase